MSRVHEKILQSAEICYMDASASFELLNTPITLLYTSCVVGALPLGLFITSDELQITLERALNLLKSILPQHAFFGRDRKLAQRFLLLMIRMLNTTPWSYVGQKVKILFLIEKFFLISKTY
jgi:hypothetical protein